MTHYFLAYIIRCTTYQTGQLINMTQYVSIQDMTTLYRAYLYGIELSL